ncbi:hypothetical protein LCGC14_2083420 [marine sediment metagenome]|uniref:Uncharacterized protein n=1 Tax=marine sediment metagenome TaxID=412755 RepID=A0A0F9EF55_9ZZZZ
MNTLESKLQPGRFTNMSPKMAAIVGCIIGAKFTDPALVELSITADGHVLGRKDGDCGLNEWIGSADDLERNWQMLLGAAGLTEEEQEQARRCYRVNVRDWREVSIS